MEINTVNTALISARPETQNSLNPVIPAQAGIWKINGLLIPRLREDNQTYGFWTRTN